MALRSSWGSRGAALGIALAAAAGASSAEPRPTPWAQFRGPDGQGVSAERGLPDEWSATRNVLWKTAIPGRGHSSPVVWGDRIFLTTAIEGEVVPGAKGVRHVVDGQDFVHPQGVGDDRRHTFKVLALDARDGRIRWEKVAHEGLPYDTRHQRGSFASQTPVTDGQLVYTVFGSEGLVFAYQMDGRLRWKVALGGIATVGVGVGTSPVLYKDLLILQCDEDNGDASFITALDKRTGKQVWRMPRKVQVSWATPVLVRAGDRDELVASGTEWIIAYAPATGAELWRAKGLESNAVPSPVVAGDVVVVSASPVAFDGKILLSSMEGATFIIKAGPVHEVLKTNTLGEAIAASPAIARGRIFIRGESHLYAIGVRAGS